MAINITHFDDCKEKYQSHEVNISGDLMDIGLYEMRVEIMGYGRNKQEAYDEASLKLKNLINRLTKVYNDLHIDDVIEVDNYRHEIKKIDI